MPTMFKVLALISFKDYPPPHPVFKSFLLVYLVWAAHFPSLLPVNTILNPHLHACWICGIAYQQNSYLLLPQFFLEKYWHGIISLTKHHFLGCVTNTYEITALVLAIPNSEEVHLMNVLLETTEGSRLTFLVCHDLTFKRLY